MVIVLSNTPGLSEVFHMSSLGASHWAFLLLWPPAVLALEEARKGLLRRRLAGAAENSSLEIRREPDVGDASGEDTGREEVRT